MLSASSLFHRCHLRIDWQGRPYLKIQSAVGNGLNVDGERFAETGVQHAWDSLGVGMGRLSSAGQQYEFYYDNKGRLTDEIMHDEYLGDYRLLRRNGWSPVGQFTGDTVVFENGLATASRSLTYNRRGQRTGETDVVTVASGQQLSGDKGGAIQYVYDSLTARLTKMVHLVTTSTGASDTLATVSWLYDRGGRDTLRTLRIPGTGSVPVTRSTHYDSHGWPDHIVEKVGSTVRYSFSNPVFSPLGEIRTADETRRTNTGRKLPPSGHSVS
jgi:hypothetical protein